MKITKATNAEKVAYMETRPVYPLYGWVEIAGHHCAIEFPNEGREGPKYEVMAPEGFHFDRDETHSLLCFSLADLRERVAYQSFAPCIEDCGGKGRTK